MNFKKMTYLCMQRLTNFPYIEEDFDAITNYELLCKVVEYLNKVIANENNQNEAIAELATSFTELKNYVDNLDLQDEVNNKIDEMVESGEFQEILFEKWYVTVEQFKEESDTDDTNAFNLAIATGKPIYLSNNTYTVSDTLTINESTKIIGKDRVKSIINFTNDNKYLFEFLTPVLSQYNSKKTNIILSNFTVNTKYFLHLNDETLEDNNWKYQASLLNININNLTLYGKYNTITDNYKLTNTISDFSTMKTYGIAINVNSMFDSTIKNCEINSFGIGIYFKGCDLNNITDNRFTINGHDIWLQRVLTYGSQNRIVHNDILQNQRYGSIRIEGNRFDTVEDNYFEPSSNNQAGCCVYGNNEYSTTIVNNRIDKSAGIDINIFDLSPSNTDNVIYNRINPASNKAICKVSTNNLSLSNTKNSVIYMGNNKKLELDGLLTYTDHINNKMISPYNINNNVHNLSGNLFNSQPLFALNETLQRYHFKNGSSGSNIYFIFEKCLDYYNKPVKIRFTYLSSVATSVYCVVKGDDTEISRGNISLLADSTLHSVDLDLESNTNIFNTINIQLVPTNNQEIYSVELI